jgi:EF-P beta-lysylation protein EpmB
MPPWQSLWRDSIRDPLELLQILGLQAFSGRLSAAAQAGFAFRVPRGFAAKMRYGDPDDPLLRQVLPITEEDLQSPLHVLDAVGDMAARQAPGVLHKYAGRALLVSTGSCAIHCRYCFRRHFPYSEENAAARQWQAAIDYLRSHEDVGELLLSGGDPLSLSTAKLAALTDQLLSIPHLKRLRLHTRLPIVLPERIDEEFLQWLGGLPWQKIVVVHANHAQELDSPVCDALRQLRASGATVLNQSVLLKGVNDDAGVLSALSERLFEAGVLPYYLHQLDLVQGVGHFAVSDAEALAIHERLMAKLPGYLVPKLVREVPGEPNKTPLL